MLIPKNNANQMRTRILIKIAESYFADKFKNADRIPLELRPKEQQPMSSKAWHSTAKKPLSARIPKRRSSASSTLPVPPASRRSTWLPTPAAAASRVPAR